MKLNNHRYIIGMGLIISIALMGLVTLVIPLGVYVYYWSKEK